jgi:hypothetical protein
MFLKRIQRNISSRGASERGSAILAVLGVMGVTMVIAVTTTTASLHAVGITTSTRASVEAEAAAEAGIDYTASMLATSVCQAQYTRCGLLLQSCNFSWDHGHIVGERLSFIDERATN